MATHGHDDTGCSAELLRRAAQGEFQARNELFAPYRRRLERMVRLHLNWRLRRRVDACEVVQAALSSATRRLPEYLASPQPVFYLWLRRITVDQLEQVHRSALGAQASDAGGRVSFYPGGLPLPAASAIAARLLGRTIPRPQSAVKVELRVQLQQAFARLDRVDRNILTLRHFEQLSNDEAAQELGLQPSAVSRLHFRALARLCNVLHNLGTPGST